MAYLRNWSEIQQVLDDTSAKKFNIRRSRGGDDQSNNNVFMYNPDQNFSENMQVAERLLQRCAGEILYLTAWRGDSAKTGGCTYTIMYDSATPVQPVQQPTPAAGLYGVGGGVDIDKLTSDIENRLRVQFEKERLEREWKELREEQKQLKSDQSSAIGLLAGYLAPIAKHLSPTMSRVAGLDAEKPVRTAPIQTIDTAPANTTQEAEESAFTDEESDKLYDLMARFKAVEPQYMELLESVVKMAEAGDSTYTMARGVLLK